MPPSTIGIIDDKGNQITQNANKYSDQLNVAYQALAGSNNILNTAITDRDNLISDRDSKQTILNKSSKRLKNADTFWDEIVYYYNAPGYGINTQDWVDAAYECKFDVTKYNNDNDNLKRVNSALQVAQQNVQKATDDVIATSNLIKSLQNIINNNPDGSKRTVSTLTDALNKDGGLKSLNIDCYTETVKTGEVCTIASAVKYGIFDKLKYFDNTKITQDEIEKIDKHLDNQNDKTLPYSLCTIDENNSNIAIQNCAITYNNPWLTLKKGTNKCALPNKIELPNGLSYNADGSVKIPPPIFRHKTKIGYCQEKWYDWFTIPDYHLGNRVMVLNEPDKPRNILKCYKPCNLGYIPRDNNNPLFINNCILKDYYNYGLYKGTFHYLPISLILLLGSTKDSLKTYYKTTLNNAKKNIIANNLILDENVYSNLYNHTNSFDNLYNNNTDPNDRGIKHSIKNRITELFTIPFEVENIIVPDNNVIEASKPIITKEKIQQAYNICKKLYELSIDPKKQVQLNEWLDQLALVSEQGKTDNKFKKQLLILKKACNVTFDGKTPYSKDYILYTLNKDIDINEVPNPPIEFNLKLSHSLYARNVPESTAPPSATGGASGAGGGASGGNSSDIKIEVSQAHKSEKLINFTPFVDSYLKYKDTIGISLYYPLIALIIVLCITFFIMLFYVLEPFIVIIVNLIYVTLRDISVLLFIDTIGHFFGFRKYQADVYDLYISEDDKNKITKRINSVTTKLDERKDIEKGVARKKAKQEEANK